MKYQLMTSLLLIAFAGIAAGGEPPKAADSASKPGWKLVFQDEFKGPRVDRTKWNLQDPWGRVRNNELQAYVDDAFSIQDGILHIRAEKKTAKYDGQERQYTSGMMTTYRKFSQRYGRFEIRCKAPKGKGLWPAFWLLPEPRAWPPEIDVLEILGHDTRTIHFTHHWKDAAGAHQSDSKAWKTGPDFATAFHVIAVEWEPTYIRWDVDGVERFRSTRSIPDGKMYMLINLAVGGDWPGAPGDSTRFPADFEVDYVRVYEQESK